MAVRRPSAVQHNDAIRERSASVAAQAEQQQNWLEKKLRPKNVTARYPIKGAPLLFATCGFGSLGDAIFGYNSGMRDPHADQGLDIADSRLSRYYVRPARQPGLH